MPTRHNYLDALRGYAIFGVIVVHVTQLVSLPDNLLTSVLRHGANGVQLFYIVSALTLFLSLSKRNESNILYFYIRRFFRIAPLFYIAIIIYLLKDGLGHRYWLGDQPQISSVNIISHFFFLHGWNPYWINSIMNVEWSVAVEMTFYILVPLLFLKITSLKRSVWFFVVTAIASIIIKYWLAKHPLILYKPLWNDYLYLSFPNQFPVLVLGIVTFFCLKYYDFSSKAKLLMIVSTIGFVSTLFFERFTFGVGHILFAGCFAIFTYALALNPIKWIVNPLIIYIGKISFSAYILHFALLTYVKLIIDQIHIASYAKYGIALIIELLLTIMISSITYLFIESTGIKLGSKIISKLKLRLSSKEITSNNETIF